MALQQLRASHAVVIAADPGDLDNMVSDASEAGTSVGARSTWHQPDG